MPLRYVRITNLGTGTIHIHLQPPGEAHKGKETPSAIVLRPGETSTAILWTALRASPDWPALRESKRLRLQRVRNVPAFRRLKARTDVPVPVRLRVRTASGQRRSKTIRVSRRHPRAVQESAIDDIKALFELVTQGKITAGPFTFNVVPARGSYGYEDDVYICDVCGGTIVFRYRPPHPVHV